MAVISTARNAKENMLTDTELAMAKNALRREIQRGNVRIMHRTTPLEKPNPVRGPAKPSKWAGVNPRSLSAEDRVKWAKWKQRNQA